MEKNDNFLLVNVNEFVIVITAFLCDFFFDMEKIYSKKVYHPPKKGKLY